MITHEPTKSTNYKNDARCTHLLTPRFRSLSVAPRLDDSRLGSNLLSASSAPGGIGGTSSILCGSGSPLLSDLGVNASLDRVSPFTTSCRQVTNLSSGFGSSES